MGTGVRGHRAVVLGGSIAGLLAARVLAEHYPEVQVLDRDDLGGHGVRRGVPQARHIHALLPRGRQLLEELFPGLTAELVAGGAASGDLLGDARLHLGGHRFVRQRSDLPTVSVSRTQLEDRVRTRVRGLPQVRIVDRCDVVGLVSAGHGRRIAGVRVLRRADGSAEETVEADLVVDAMGRGSRVPAWLQGLGYERPEEDRVEVALVYATRRYRLADAALEGDWGTLQGPTADCLRGGTLARIEGDTWMVTLFGLLGEQPPAGDARFVDFARSLPFPDIHRAIRHGQPLDNAAVYRFPASVRRRYDQVPVLPQGLVPVGDSVCSFNPIYGQGMTVAGLAALELHRHLATRPAPEPRRFVRRLGEVLDPPWSMVLGGDLALPGVEGPRTRTTRLAGAYMAQAQATAAHDSAVAKAFARVMALVEPPETLMRPGIVARVLRSTLRDGNGPPRHTPTQEVTS